MTATRIPFLSMKPREDAADVHAAIQRVIDRGWFVLGPEVEAFEGAFAAASGAARSVGVGTGTDALMLILKALGIGPGDEVITTPLSAAYTALAVIMAGGRGERFWPQSREATPKHLLPIVGNTPMLAQTVNRVVGVVPRENIFVITTQAQLEGCREACPDLP